MQTLLKLSLWSGALAISAMGCQSEKKQEDTQPKEVASYTIEQFFDNVSIGGGAFSPNEDKLLVNSNATGIYNVYEIDLATKEIKPVTSSEDESYFAVDYVPGTDAIMYSADQGGNENDHIYLLEADGTTTDLTPGAEEKANFLRWTDDEKAFYYVSNVRDARFFDLYKMQVGTWDTEMVYENTEGYSVSDVSWDDKFLALEKSITRDESQLFIYNLESQEMTEVSDPAQPGAYRASYFTHNGESFDYITNAGEEFSYVVRYTLATGDREVHFATNWDVMYTYGSKTDQYYVTAINADGKTELKITDGEGNAVTMPEIPDGSVLAINISDSEKLARLSVGSSKSPTDLYVYNFESGEMTRLTNSLNDEIAAEDLVSAEVVRYASFDQLEIPAIYYKPHQATAENPVPALVWVHGGPGGQSRVGFNPFIQYLVNHGYAVLAVNNRGSSGYGKTFFQGDDRNHGDKDLQDCIYGKKYLQGIDYIDHDRIGIIGGSYGGYMVMAALAFAPEEFDVGVNLFGVTNWIRTLREIPPYWEAGRKALYQELGDPYTEDSVRLYEISPLFHTQHIVKPTMVLQGANDPRVQQIESDEIVEGVKANGVPVEYVVFPDEGHGFIKKENQIHGYREVLNFLNKYLKGMSEEGTTATP